MTPKNTPPMQATILDKRKDGDSDCYLCRITLEHYIQALPNMYQDYDVQREIVSNVYLDDLITTVLAHRHIPPIVLVVENLDFKGEGDVLDVKRFKILDGLQRTFRLQAIRKTIAYCCEHLDPEQDYLNKSKYAFSREFSQELREINSTTDVLRSIIEVFQRGGKQELLASFNDNGQWFEIWTGLTAEEEVRKMLLLNAGHKPVRTRHQLELLFLNLLPSLRAENDAFTIVREKDVSATQFSKSRKPGTFHFASIITSLLSIYEARPIATSTSLIQNIQSSDAGIEKYTDFITPSFLKKFVHFLVVLDSQVASQYGDVGVQWMGREICLAGLFAAIGDVAEKTGEDRTAVMDRFIDITRRHPKVLNLTNFEEVRNSLDLSKVNFGNVNRDAVFSAVKEILSKSLSIRIDWRTHFGMEAK